MLYFTTTNKVLHSNMLTKVENVRWHFTCIYIEQFKIDFNPYLGSS